MTTKQVFDNFIMFFWDGMDTAFKKKYKSYKSKYITGSDYLGESKMKEILLASGLYTYEEKWTEKK